MPLSKSPTSVRVNKMAHEEASQKEITCLTIWQLRTHLSTSKIPKLKVSCYNESNSRKR